MEKITCLDRSNQMSKRSLLAALVAIAFASQTQAQTPCAMTYETFEFAVPHLDLESCPKDLARKGAFCRASAANDAVHVFVFSEEGDRCLLSARSYQVGQYQFAIK
jgi:hypothetical protein